MVASQRNRVALGRGLGSLIPAAERQSGTGETGIKKVSVDEVLPGDSQPRKHFDDDSLLELADSIKEHGILQPIVVRKRGAGFEIVAGERRWRASKLADQTEIPVIVVEMADEKALAIALVENLQREDLNAMEEAESYKRLSDQLGYTQDQIAKAIGKDRTTITNALRLLKLPTEIQQHVVTKSLSMGHARALLGLGDAGAIMRAASRVIDEGMSVRGTETLVQNILAGRELQNNNKNSGLSTLGPEEKEIRRRLERFFSTKIKFKHAEGRGAFTVHFNSKDELNEMLTKLSINI